MIYSIILVPMLKLIPITTLYSRLEREENSKTHADVDKPQGHYADVDKPQGHYAK